MNANDPAAAPTSAAPKATSTHVRPRASRNTMIFYFGACLVGTLIAAYAWTSTPSTTRLAADAMRLASVASKVNPTVEPRTSPITAPVPASAASAAGSASASRNAIDLRSPRLDADVQRLAQQASEAERRLEQLEAIQNELRAKVDQIRAEAVLQQSSTKALPPAARSIRAPAKAIVEPAHETVLPPQVLAVDMWNGQPSVSIIVGTQVRFLTEGDTVSDLLIKMADPATQRVEFVARDGTVVSAVAQPAGGAK